MARLHDANEVLPVYNKRPGKVSQVPRRRKSKGEKKDDIPVDPRKIEAKLALRDLARESNARIGETLANFEDFVRKDKRFLRSGKTGDAYQAASEAFEDAEFLFTEVDRITDEQVDSMEEMNKWFNNNIEEGSLMEAEFLDAEEESKGLTDLLETSERVKMDYLYTAANAGNNMKKIFGNVKKAAEDGVKNAVAHAEQHVAEMEKHKKEKRRLQIIGALHHHRATKNTAGAAEPFEEKEEATKGPKPNVKGLLGAASKFKTKKKVKEPEVEEREPEESDLDYYNRTRKDKIVSESEEEEEEVVEEEDDEFKELLDQIATMKAEMDELKKQKKEDETKVKMAEAKVDQLTQKFAAYRQDTDNKEVNFRRQKASLNEQLMRESTRAREKELEERAKFEAETFIHKSANRKGAEASEIKEKALRKEIHGLQDKLQKLIVVKEKQDEELEELRIEVAKPKIEPEEYERVCQLQRETDDALAVLQTEFGQFKIDAAQEKKMLEQKIFDAQEETEKERQKVQETLKRALAAEKQVENLEKEVKNLEQKLIEAEEEKIRAVAEERERGEKLLAEQVLKTEAETARADAAEEEVERLEAEIEDLKIQHAKEVEKLTNRIETLEHEVDVLKEFATDIMGSAIELTSKGGEQCRVIIEEHYRADKLKKYIEVGNSEPDEEAILDSSKLDGMPIVAEILHVAVDLTSASHADVEEYGKLVSDFDSGKSLRDLIFAVENTTAVKTGLIEAPESTKAIDKRLEESQKSIDKCRVRLATSGDITADKAKKYIKAGIDTAMTALISNKTDRAANRVQIRDDARKLAKEKAEALLACLRGDREEAYAHADSLATPLVQTSQLLHRLRYYLETSWEDEKEDADVLIAEVHKLESNNIVRKMVGECFDLALPKLKKKPVNDLVALIIQRRNIVRSIRLGRVDDPPLKPEKIKKLNNNLKAVVEKMSKLRASMKSMVDVSDEHFDWYFPFMGKLEHTDDMLGLVDRGEQHEAKRLEIGGEIEKIENAQNGVLGELQKHRTKKSAERVQSRNVAIAEKVEKTKALIESLELGVERRNGAITITLDQIKLLKKALTDHSILLQKLKVHAGSHGKIHERGKLVAAAHKLELESTIVTSIVGPCIDLRAAEKKIIKILRDTQMVVYENMLRLSYETDEKEREAIKSSLEKGFETVRKSKSDFIRSGGMCDLMDEENATRDQENDVQQHLNAEADLATLTLQLQLDPGSQSLMEQVQLATNNVESLSMTIVKRRQSLAMVLFDFEDEEAKKPSPLQLERDALKVKLEATETEYEQSKVTWEGEKTTLTEDLSETKTSLEEAMKELMRLQATDIDTVLDNQSKERFALAMLSFKIEDAIRYLSRQAPLSAESSKPQIPSKKNMWIANRTKVQNVPEGVEVKERDQSDLIPPLVSKEVQTLLKHIEKCVGTIMKLEFDSESGGGGGGSYGGGADRPDARPMKSIKKSLRISRADGKGRGQPGVKGKIEPKNLSAIAHMRHVVADQKRQMSILEIELKAQTDQHHGYGELEATERRVRKDKKYKRIKSKARMQNLNNGLKMQRINEVLEKATGENVSESEKKALMHRKTKLEFEMQKGNEMIESAEQKREENLLYALSALERVQVAAETIISDLPSNEVLDRAFEKREELRRKMMSSGTESGKFPSLTGQGYPHLHVSATVREVNISSPSTKARQRTPSKMSSFGSSAPRTAFTDRQAGSSSGNGRTTTGSSVNQYIKQGLFVGQIESADMSKHIRRARSMSTLGNKVSPVAMRRTSPNMPPWFPAKDTF